MGGFAQQFEAADFEGVGHGSLRGCQSDIYRDGGVAAGQYKLHGHAGGIRRSK